MDRTKAGALRNGQTGLKLNPVNVSFGKGLAISSSFKSNIIKPKDLENLKNSKAEKPKRSQNLFGQPIISPQDLSNIQNTKTVKTLTRKTPAKKTIISSSEIESKFASKNDTKKTVISKSDLSSFSKRSSKPANFSSVQKTQKPDPKNPQKPQAIITPADITSFKPKRAKPGQLTIPQRVAIIKPEDLENLKFLSQLIEDSTTHHIDTKVISENLKTSKQLAREIRKCMKELRSEAQQCASASRVHHEEHDVFSRNSFTCTPTSSCLIGDRAKEFEISDMKNKLDTLINKMYRSEAEAKVNEFENQRLKEIIKRFERKLENDRMFKEKKAVGCSGGCGVF